MDLGIAPDETFGADENRCVVECGAVALSQSRHDMKSIFRRDPEKLFDRRSEDRLLRAGLKRTRQRKLGLDHEIGIFRRGLCDKSLDRLEIGSSRCTGHELRRGDGPIRMAEL
jgi:hypothetical protein